MKRTKRIIFSIIPTAGLLVLLAGTELVLRWTRPDPVGPLVTETRFDGIDWYQVNRSYLAHYFPPDVPTLPELKETLFRRTKLPNTVRIFCLGESSMFGTPYEMTGIPAIVARQLRHRWPDREFEVVNWGASAINSNVIADMAPAIAGCNPDLVLIYTGHNEYYGPDGVGAGLLERWFPSLTHLKYELNRLRLVSGLRSLIASMKGKPAAGTEHNLMRQVSQGQLVPAGSAHIGRIEGNFERNLSAIIRPFRERNIPVILSEVTSNLMFPPFVSDSASVSPSGRALLAAIDADSTLIHQKGVEDSIRLLVAADSLNAAAQYWLGQILLANGRYADAKERLISARELDLLKFRATNGINRIIRKVAAEEHYSCVRADSIFSAVSAGGIPGNELFWEHLHPTLRGYYLIACGFVDKICAGGILNVPAGGGRTLPGILPLDYDSLKVAWVDLGYADRSIRNLTGHWPFVNYRREAVVLDSADQALKGIIEDLYTRRVGWDEGCNRTAVHFWQTGRLRQARITYEAMLEDNPYSYYVNYLLGSLLNAMNSSGEAIPRYQRSVSSNPQFAKSRIDLGLLYINNGRFVEGIRQLDTALGLPGTAERRDASSMIYYGLAGAYANLGNVDTAILLARRSLGIDGQNRDAAQLLTKLMAARK